MATPEKLPIGYRLAPNRGVPLVNAELAPFKHLPRRERKAALRHFKKLLEAHMKFKLKQGVRLL